MEIGFILLSVLCPILVLIAYRQGIRDKQSIDNGIDIQPLPQIPKKRHNTSIEEIRDQVLLDNLNTYDGTDRGQREIK